MTFVGVKRRRRRAVQDFDFWFAGSLQNCLIHPRLTRSHVERGCGLATSSIGRPSAGSVLGHRERRWPNTEPAHEVFPSPVSRDLSIRQPLQLLSDLPKINRCGMYAGGKRGNAFWNGVRYFNLPVLPLWVGSAAIRHCPRLPAPRHCGPDLSPKIRSTRLQRNQSINQSAWDQS